MADTISTSLELQLRGVREAVTGLNQVGASSRAMAMETEGHAEKFSKLSKVLGKAGGAGKFEFLVVSGISEAIDGAQGSWSKFLGSVGQTAAFAGAAIAIDAILTNAHALSDETDKLYESMGRKPPGMMQNWLTGWKMMLGFDSGNPENTSVGDTTAARESAAIKQGQAFLKTMKSENSPETKFDQWLNENKSTLTGMNIHEREALERKQWEAINEGVRIEKEKNKVNEEMTKRLEKKDPVAEMFFGGTKAQLPALEQYAQKYGVNMSAAEFGNELKSSPEKLKEVIEEYVKAQSEAAEFARKADAKSKEFANNVATKVAEGESSGQRDFSGERFLSLRRRNESMMGPQIDDRILMAQAKGETDRAEMAAREQLAADDANRSAMAERIKNPRFGGADIVGGVEAYRASNLVAFGNSVNPADKASAQQLTESQKQSRFQETMARAMETLERGSRSGSLFVIGAGSN